jgi:nucleotide-binding universal stress UspA family protein
MKISDVLVPTDFSPGSMRALDFARSLVEPGGEIYLLHVIDADFVTRLTEEGFGEPEGVTERLRQRAEERVGEVRQAATGLQQSLETMVVVGKPFAEILRVASDLDFSMIVLGVRGRREADIEEMLFGSTAEKVLRGARVPVVCVPPGWAK